jgi:2Fe-2S ferredoxin
MGGKNPYIEQETKYTLPTKKYKVTFAQEGKPGQGKTFEVDPAKIPYHHDGLPGSILDIALGNGIPLDHACGGVCACSTCHVIVHEGLDSCNEASDPEYDQLDEAAGVTAKSRLSCQCVPDGSKDIVVEIPGWNRNYARETEH